MNNQFGIDFDYPGLCALCHKEIAEFNGSQQVFPGVFRPVIERFKKNMREIVVELSNSSKMTVLLCDECSKLKPEDMGPLMESVINGWQFEVDTLLPHWDTEKKLKHMENFSKLEATGSLHRKFSKEEKTRITKPDKSKLKIKIKEAVKDKEKKDK